MVRMPCLLTVLLPCVGMSTGGRKKLTGRRSARTHERDGFGHPPQRARACRTVEPSGYLAEFPTQGLGVPASVPLLAVRFHLGEQQLLETAKYAFDPRLFERRVREEYEDAPFGGTIGCAGSGDAIAGGGRSVRHDGSPRYKGSKRAVK
jgi:hypothetical protein